MAIMMAEAAPAVDTQADPAAIEAQVRRDLAACFRLVAHYGWDDMTATHISARLPDDPKTGEEVFLINPYGMLFDEITASCLIKINAAGEILAPTSYMVNPAGFVIHSAVHMARPDAGCVMHLHSPDGVAVSCIAEGLMPLSQTAMVVRTDIAFHDYEGVATNLEERTRLQQDLGEKHLMLLRNHGTLGVGRTVAEAWQRMSLLERACTVQVRALSMGRQLYDADPQVIAHTGALFDTKAVASSARMTWPAFLRLLDRVNPGYAD